MSEPKSEGSYQPDSPAIRIIISMFRGDPYSVDSIISPLSAEPTSCITPDRTILVDTFLGGSKRRAEFIISSCHGTNAHRDDPIHGPVLLYSTKGGLR